MDTIFSSYEKLECVVYLDDIILFLNSFEENVKDVTDVLFVLEKTRVYLKLEKSKFLREIFEIFRSQDLPWKVRRC